MENKINMKTESLAKSNGVFQWKFIRLSLLALTLFSIVGVLVNLVLSHKTEETEKTEEVKPSSDFVFPREIPIEGWNLDKTSEVKLFKTSPLGPGLAPGLVYHYSNNGDSLEIEGRYEKYKGNINKFIVIYRNFVAATIKPKIKYKEGIGYYGLFQHEDTAYLSSCVNPKGQTTVTEDQFVSNRYAHGWGIQRTLLWIIGYQDLLDGRCLWTLMSMPIKSQDPYAVLLDKDLEPFNQKLEKAWVEWHGWWKNNFPSY